MRALMVAIALLAAGFGSSPSRAQDPLQAELASVLEHYYAAQRAGDFDGMMAVSSAHFRAQMSGVFSSEAEKQAFMEWEKKSAPDSFDVLHLEPGGADGTATLSAIAHGNRPPASPDGEWTKGDTEVDVSFVDEGGWKIAMIMVGIDPAAIQRSADASFEPIDAYDTDTFSNLGGRIVRTEFNEDHTLVVVRLMDEEDFVYLPSRQELIDGGFNPDLLVPNATVEIEGYPHRSDKFKVWVTGLDVIE